jgi:hypothetical protein
MKELPTGILAECQKQDASHISHHLDSVGMPVDSLPSASMDGKDASSATDSHSATTWKPTRMSKDSTASRDPVS